MRKQDLPAPLVLVVDDDARARQLAKTAFSDRDCSVVGVADADEAVWEMRSAPGIDLLFTDVKLSVTDDDDTSGMRLGNYVKDIRPDIPVALYSSRFYEGELDEALDSSARDRFDIVVARGGREWKDAAVLNDCVALATHYRNQRFADAVSRKGGSAVTKLTVMREFIVGGTSRRASDAMLKTKGYTLRLLDVRHGEVRGPMAVWVLEHGNQVSAELYQYSRAHAVGSTVEDALQHLAAMIDSELTDFAPNGESPTVRSSAIPWLMLQYADEWERLASDIESRD
jgi:CheY-like chemotaxis protein